MDTPYSFQTYSDIPRLAIEVFFSVNYLGSGASTFDLVADKSFRMAFNGSATKDVKLGAIRSYIWLVTGAATYTNGITKIASFRLLPTANALITQQLQQFKFIATNFHANSDITTFVMLRKAGLDLYIPGQAFIDNDMTQIKKRTSVQVIDRPSKHMRN